MTTVFVPKETAPGETRVAATPDSVKTLVNEGFAVIVEAGAGHGSFLDDEAYRQAGAAIGSAADWERADVVLALRPPSDAHVAKLKTGALIIGFLAALAEPARVAALRERKVTAFAMELLPRTTRSQPMDALSSQSTIAGYLAVLLAATRLPKMLPLLMTAAGTIRPARVVVVGAGVAGLSAIATARRLGAVVEASDVRPQAYEDVASLGARFLDVPTDAMLQDKHGYAREASADFLQRQRQALRPHLLTADAIITTALVPGKQAPLLIPNELVAQLSAGTVIVDLAAEAGGNCEATAGEETVTDNGVVVLGPRNLAARVPVHASQTYAQNVLAVVRHLFPRPRRGEAPRDHTQAPRLDFRDVIIAEAVVTHAGEVTSERVAALLGVTARRPEALPPVAGAEAPAEAAAGANPFAPASATADEGAGAGTGTAAGAPRPAEAATESANDVARRDEDEALASDDDEAEAVRRASRRASRRLEHGLESPEENATEHSSPHPEDDNNAPAGVDGSAAASDVPSASSSQDKGEHA